MDLTELTKNNIIYLNYKQRLFLHEFKGHSSDSTPTVKIVIFLSMRAIWL